MVSTLAAGQSAVIESMPESIHHTDNRTPIFRCVFMVAELKALLRI
ncbi:hypothetical protein GBAR_LOCUS25680 [Geodia barretti]|uniref:Uncharacterized protein n=1 Tax=Geodia barretti TaxID=519541 RepID=A0AA35TEC9_GEOBA|nr:hypothetical protein GBAR_LOCUS25680 [Geodia barretti]